MQPPATKKAEKQKQRKRLQKEEDKAQEQAGQPTEEGSAKKPKTRPRKPTNYKEPESPLDGSEEVSNQKAPKLMKGDPILLFYNSLLNLPG